MNVFTLDESESFGDTFTLMLVPVGVVSKSMGVGYKSTLQLLLGILAMQGTIEGVRSGFEFAHKKGHSVLFAKNAFVVIIAGKCQADTQVEQ